ncbi:helix-turn-helix domain-containing protein, partial [Natrinema versiforme]|uniref:helix-turn-helix domain-containing protein n=1 Tax=Natrinema versiforme TaxID=88724 RepID=UPI001EF9EED5
MEVLKAAFEAGYYDWPRGCSGEEVAAELGIASPTFSQHILSLIHISERAG